MLYNINILYKQAKKLMTLTTLFASRILEYLALNLSSEELRSNTAVVYIANLNNCKQSIPIFWKCLSFKEQLQAQQYYTSDLRDRYVISHGILRYILSYYTHQLPQNVEFIYNEYGKPFLKNNNNIQFNMSHSHNMVSYIIAFDFKVGIDIEFQDSTIEIQGLSNLVLTSKEQELIINLDTKKKLELFYRLWTTKESLIKASGHGFYYPVNTIEALHTVPGDKIILPNAENSITQELYSYTLEIAPDFSAAIAIEKKINEIIYVKMCNHYGGFNKISAVYLQP